MLTADGHEIALLSLSSRYANASDLQFSISALFIHTHFQTPDPVFHQNAFALITAIVLFRSMYIMEVNIRPSLRGRYATIPRKPGTTITQTQRLENEKRDREILKVMWMMVLWGLSIFLGGFAIWGLDRVFCGTIRRWRQEVGLPWGLLLEGHGWWFVFPFGFGT